MDAQVSPVTRYQYVTVVFGTAGVDLAIDHTLAPGMPDLVDYEVVQRDRPCHVYHDETTDRRPWKAAQMFLRCDTDDARVTLRLTLPANPPERDGTTLPFDGVLGGAPVVSDTVYGAGWNGDTAMAPSKNAVYDKIEAVIAAGGIPNPIVQDLLFTDATYDIGKSGATRPRDLFASRNGNFGGTLGVTGVATLAALLDLSGASAGQIKFPAARNASADANTLDDYEEGSWTPVLGGTTGTSGQTYSIQVGRYVKVGKQVVAWCNVQLSAVGTVTGNAQISGLPFTSENVTNFYGTMSVGEWLSTPTSFVWMSGIVAPNSSVVAVRVSGSGGTSLSGIAASNAWGSTTWMQAVVVYSAG